MKTGEGSGDEPNQRALSCLNQEKSEEAYSGDTLSITQGGAFADASELEYLSRKALSADGQWNRVKETQEGCWEWKGAKDARGYGVLPTHGAGTNLVHRALFSIFNGRISPTAHVCHSCNNKACLNPKHLVVGNAINNAYDHQEARGRKRPIPLTEAVIAEAKRLYREEGISIRDLAAKFGSSGSAMLQAFKGVPRLTWFQRHRIRQEKAAREVRP